MIYKNALITTKDKQFLGWIEIDENHFIKSINQGQTQLDGYDCQNKIIMPAFIDSHIHGGYNLSFNDFDKFENYQNFLINLKAEGVGAFVGASVTAKLDQLKLALKPIKNLINNHNDNLPQMVGWYFEGPFISKTKKGAHQEDLITSLNENFLLDLKTTFKDLPIILTVAAEDVQNQQLIKKYQNDLVCVYTYICIYMYIYIAFHVCFQRCTMYIYIYLCSYVLIYTIIYSIVLSEETEVLCI